MSQTMPSAELLQGVEAGIEQALRAIAERERLYPVAAEPEPAPSARSPEDLNRREIHFRKRQELLERSNQTVSTADAELLQVEEQLREWCDDAEALDRQVKTRQER
jgi:hypothetical protein